MIALLLLVLIGIMVEKPQKHGHAISDLGLSFILISGCYSRYKKKEGQFIEWREDEIEFKTGGNVGIINIGQIKKITIALDSVTIDLADGNPGNNRTAGFYGL